MRKNIMQKIKCKIENIVRRIEELKSVCNTAQGRGKKIGVIIVLVLIWSVSLVCLYAERIENDIADSVVRLHILANSNSDEDQQLKLEVRDHLLEYMRKQEEGLPSEAVLADLAKEYLVSRGSNYSVKAEYCNMYFPTKEYNNVKFPAGRYNALRVVIGEGAGENWWCVMYPPLCMTNAYEGGLSEQSQDMLQNQMSEEGYAIINFGNEGNSGEFKFKFKLVEWYGEIKEYVSGWWG